MINLIKKLQIIAIILIVNSSAFALTSSSFLISQSAYENYDYSSSLLNFDIDDVNLSEDSLLDKAIAAIITDDIDLASKIAKNILTEDKNNAEALIITAASFYKEEKFNKIIELRKNLEKPSEVLEYIFFSNNTLKDIDTISRALVEIVSSSYSNNEQRRLNYNFLLFYISLAKIIAPENDRAIIIKAELFDQVGQHKAAVNIYKQVNKNNIFYLDAQNNLARHYLFNSPYEQAEVQIKSIVENNNNNYSLKRVLADFYRYNKKFDLALKIYDEMIKENQDDLWNIYYMRGICYERKDNWELAEKDFLKSLELQPGTPNVLNYLAYGWVERDIKLDRSLKMLEKAYKANPDSFYIIDSLAWAHFKKNNLKEAARLMEKVIDIAPGEAISLDHLGDIYYAMNRKREAIHFWQQALELAEPEDEITEDVQSKLDNINAG